MKWKKKVLEVDKERMGVRMTLGMISWIQEEDFKRVKEKGLSFVELDVNDRAEEFLEHVDEIKEYSEQS